MQPGTAAVQNAEGPIPRLAIVGANVFEDCRLRPIDESDVGKVQAMYLKTLGVDLRPKLTAVAVAIPTRHHIVHRNGRDQDGVVVDISSEDVRKLIQSVEEFALDIQQKLHPAIEDL